MQSHQSDSNRRPMLYESIALPTELRWQRPRTTEGGAVKQRNRGSVKALRLAFTTGLLMNLRSREGEAPAEPHAREQGSLKVTAQPELHASGRTNFLDRLLSQRSACSSNLGTGDDDRHPGPDPRRGGELPTFLVSPSRRQFRPPHDKLLGIRFHRVPGADHDIARSFPP